MLSAVVLSVAAGACCCCQSAAAGATPVSTLEKQSAAAGLFELVGFDDVVYPSGHLGLHHAAAAQALQTAAAAAAQPHQQRLLLQRQLQRQRQRQRRVPLGATRFLHSDYEGPTTDVAGGQTAEQVPTNQSGGGLLVNVPTGLPVECKNGFCPQWGLNRIKATGEGRAYFAAACQHDSKALFAVLVQQMVPH